MFLEYLALCLILIVVVGIFYTFIFIHDLPYEAAKRRNHPQQEAIHVACWLSLFTLHAIWPLVYIWALSKRGSLEVKVSDGQSPGNDAAGPGPVGSPGDGELPSRIDQLEARLRQLEEQTSRAAEGPRRK